MTNEEKKIGPIAQVEHTQVQKKVRGGEEDAVFLNTDKSVEEKKIEGYHLFRDAENILSIIVFFVSWSAIIVIILGFIYMFFSDLSSKGTNLLRSIVESEHGAGYLLLAVIAPALWIAAGNFAHRRGDKKSEVPTNITSKITEE